MVGPKWLKFQHSRRDSGLNMRMMRVCNVEAEIAETMFQRMRGLLGYDFLASGKGLLILKCNAIHIRFMRFPIDVTFLDRDGKVVKVVRNIRPWRLCVWGGWLAKSVLETVTDLNLENLRRRK